VTNLHSTWWNQYKDSSISSINPFMLLPAMLNIRYSSSLLEFPMELFINAFWALIQDEEPLSRCYGAIGWAIILLPFLFVWYRQRLKNFSPYNIEEPISYEEAKEIIKNSTFAESTQ
jgi:hypothetical protein